MLFGLRAIAAIVVTLVLLVVLAVVALSVVGGGSDDGDDDAAQDTGPQPTPTLPATTSPEAALATFVQTSLGKPYAGDCTQAIASTDADKLCSTSKGEYRNFRGFQIFQVSPQRATTWVFLAQQGAAWTVSSSLTITPENQAIPGTPWPLQSGAEVVVTGSNPEGLNVREGPGLNQKAVDALKDGTKITLAAGPTPADGIEWWQVAGRAGWVAAHYLRYADAPQ